MKTSNLQDYPYNTVSKQEASEQAFHEKLRRHSGNSLVFISIH